MSNAVQPEAAGGDTTPEPSGMGSQTGRGRQFP